jgi:hypothetical protein
MHGGQRERPLNIVEFVASKLAKGLRRLVK